jgi:cold shock CspA family protein
MKAGFWKCPLCEGENAYSAQVCQSCWLTREPDELVGISHPQHLAASLANKGRWRMASAGRGHVVVAARSRSVAEAKGAELLSQDAAPDQTVVVTQVRRRAWLVYVRSELTPYPSALKPWQAESARRAMPRASVATRDPVAGRTYIGRVLVWSDDRGYGSISCADRRIGNISLRSSDLDERQEAALRAGQHVGFTIKKTPEGLFATDIVLLGPPNAAG